jgi:hypothetical protein
MVLNKAVSCKVGDATAGFIESEDLLSRKKKTALSDMFTCQANSFIVPLWARVPRVVVHGPEQICTIS